MHALAIALLAVASMIEGETIDAETGRTVDGASIELRQLDGGTRRASKSNVGRPGGIQIGGIPDGRYSLTFTHDGYERATLTVDVPRQAQLGSVRMKRLPRAPRCRETAIARAEAEELAIVAAAVAFMGRAQRNWWSNPEPVDGFHFPTELLLLDETLPVPFDDVADGRVKTLRAKPLWKAFRTRAAERRSLRGMETPPRVRLACGESIESAMPQVVIRTWPRASQVIAASLPAIVGNEALVYVATRYDEEGFVVYLDRAGGAWKARWHVQVSPAGC